jgi:hypothetical protein
MPESPSEPSRPKYNLPLPQGIDHEVPRWSAIYSMYSEALRLIPPEGFQASDKRKRDVSITREQSLDRKRSCSTTNHPFNSNTRAGDIQHESHESSITTRRIDATISSSDALSSIKPTTPAEEIRPMPMNSGAGIIFSELDALLRF